MHGQKRVSGNQPVFRAIKCISKSFKAFLRSETIDIDFFALSLTFILFQPVKFLPFHIACKQAVRLGESGKGHETAARALCGEPEVKVKY